MKIGISDYLKCAQPACAGVKPDYITFPNIELDTDKIRAIMIAEVPPQDLQDYFYTRPDSFYFQTTSQAFKDAGVRVNSMGDIVDLGIYVTTAVKCPKVEYGVPTNTVRTCSKILEKEVGLFPNLKVYMLMGDVAIKAVNYIAKVSTGKSIIPSGSTYKIRYGEYYYKAKRVFPSYLCTGGNYLIEKTKREMIAEDIRRALRVMNS